MKHFNHVLFVLVFLLTSCVSSQQTDEVPEQISEIAVIEQPTNRELWSIDRASESLSDHHVVSQDRNYPLFPKINKPQSNKGVFFPVNYYYDTETIYTSESSLFSAFNFQSGQRKWQSEIDGFALGAGSETVFVLTNENDIYGLDKITGESKWRIILGSLFKNSNLYLHPKILNNGNGYVLIVTESSDNQQISQNWLLVIDEITGDVSLIPIQFEDYQPLLPIAFVDNVLIAQMNLKGISLSNEYVGVDIKDGSIVWNFFPDKTLYTFKIDIDMEVLFIKSNFADLIALDMITGNQIWAGSLLEVNPIVRNSQPLSDIVFAEYEILEKYILGETSDTIFVFDIKTGALINSIPVSPKRAVIYSGNKLVVYNLESHVLQGIDYLNGNILWEDSEPPIEPIEAGNDDEDVISVYMNYISYKDVIVIPGVGYQNIAIDSRTGKQLWALPIATINDMRQCVVYEDKLLCFGYGGLHLIDLYTGNEEIMQMSYGSYPESWWIEVINQTSFLVSYDRLYLFDLSFQ